MRADWRLAAAVVQHMRRTVREQHDIPASKLLHRSRIRVLENGPALDDDMVGDLVGRGLRPDKTPWCAVGAADLELAGHGDDLQEMT